MEKKIGMIIRIALIGPESTAKSTLSDALAKHYHTIWIKERSREYLNNHSGNYTLEDIEIISRQQLQEEKESLSIANNFLFADTELIISKVWCEDVFGNCPEWINEEILNNRYDLYLLTFPDLPWEEDPLRENPHRRMFFFEWYEKELRSINANYQIIKGVGEERLKNAIKTVEDFSAGIKK